MPEYSEAVIDETDGNIDGDNGEVIEVNQMGRTIEKRGGEINMYSDSGDSFILQQPPIIDTCNSSGRGVLDGRGVSRRSDIRKIHGGKDGQLNVEFAIDPDDEVKIILGRDVGDQTTR